MLWKQHVYMNKINVGATYPLGRFSILTYFENAANTNMVVFAYDIYWNLSVIVWKLLNSNIQWLLKNMKI